MRLRDLIPDKYHWVRFTNNEGAHRCCLSYAIGQSENPVLYTKLVMEAIQEFGFRRRATGPYPIICFNDHMWTDVSDVLKVIELAERKYDVQNL